MAEIIGSAVYEVSAPMETLEKQLFEMEAAIRRSAEIGQAEFNKLGAAAGRIEAPTYRASGAISALGQAAALSGSSTAILTAQTVQLGNSLAGVATSLGLGIAKFGPYGLALAAIGGLIWSIFNPDVITDWWYELDKATDKLKEIENKLSEIRTNEADLIQKGKEKLEILRGQADAYTYMKGVSGETKNERRAIDVQIAQEEAVQRMAAEEAKGIELLNQRIAALQNEVFVLDGTKTKYDLIVDAQERSLTLTRDRITEEKRLADQIVAQEQSRADQFKAAAGPQTVGEAFGFIQDRMQLIRAQDHSRELLARQIELLAAQGDVSEKTIERLTAASGLAGTDTKRSTTSGFGTSLAAFAASGRSGLGSVGITLDPEQRRRDDTQQRQLLAEERTASGIALLVAKSGSSGMGA